MNDEAPNNGGMADELIKRSNGEVFEMCLRFHFFISLDPVAPG